jgi:hypothetical protein
MLRARFFSFDAPDFERQIYFVTSLGGLRLTLCACGPDFI